MLYLIESQNRYQADYCDALYIKGSEQEVEQFKRQVVSLALSAVNSNELLYTEATHLISAISSQDPRGAIQNGLEKPFLNLINPFDTHSDLSLSRRDQLVLQGASAVLTASQVYEEFKLLDDYNGPIGSYNTVKYVTSEGYAAFIKRVGSNYAFLPDFTQASELSLASEKSDMIAQLAILEGNDKAVAAYEIIPHGKNDVAVLSDHENFTLGKIALDGSFEPFVTILSAGYYSS